MWELRLCIACHAGDAVTDGTMYLWKGFVSLILGAYFEKRMAWYPVVRPDHLLCRPRWMHSRRLCISSARQTPA